MLGAGSPLFFRRRYADGLKEHIGALLDFGDVGLEVYLQGIKVSTVLAGEGNNILGMGLWLEPDGGSTGIGPRDRVDLSGVVEPNFGALS